MQSTDFDKIVQQFKNDYENQIGKSELATESKELVDELVLRLLDTTQDFVAENKLTNEHHYIGAMITHRAYFYMATTVTNNWCMEVALRRFINNNYSKIKDAQNVN